MRTTKDGSGTFTSQITEENPNSATLVSRQPCLNGYANTIDNIGSGVNHNMNSGTLEDPQNPQIQPQSPNLRLGNKPSLVIPKMSKFNNEKEVVMSPGLKSALNKSSNDRGKQLSVFKKATEEKKMEEENKNN